MRRSAQLKHTALLAALASIYPLQALAAAGITQFTLGDVSVQRASAAASPLARGNNVESGDLITTGDSGRTQLRFTDGGMVSLQPNSQFKITRYADSGNAQQDSFLVDLARGGMRALTGLIGKRNRENYKVTTSTATIGIRGSGFSMAYNSDGTLAVTTELDAIEVCTQAGCVGLNVGESALVTGANVRPTRTRERAHWNPPNPRRLIAARNDYAATDGGAATVPRQVIANLAYTGAGLRTEEVIDSRNYLDGAILVESGVVQGYRARNNDQGASGTVTELDRTGTIAGGDLMLLGTWANANWSGGDAATVVQSAFVIGQTTPQAAVANLSGLRGRYDLTSGAPVYSSSGAGILESSSHVIVDFRSTFNNLDINLDVSLPSNEYLVGQSSSIGNGGGGLYNLRGAATATSAGFTGALGITSSDGEYHEGSGTASGFFGGPQAGNLGLSFTGVTERHGVLAGAGVFSSTGTAAIPETTHSISSLELHVLDGGNLFDFGDEYSVNNSFSLGEGSATFNGTQLTVWSGESIDLRQNPTNAAPVRLYGSVGQPADNNFLGWGSWANATLADDGPIALTQVHYIVGKPSSSMPYSGNATYSLIGGTVPTSTLGGNGQLLSTSNLAVNFGAVSITANINLLFGSTAVNFVQAGDITGSSFRSVGCSNRYFSGIFSGPNAMRAGLVYGVNGHSTLGNIRGAAAFQSTTVPFSGGD